MKVEWTEPAVSDLESIKVYITRDSEYYASRFVERVIQAIENLLRFPEVGRKVPEAEEENIRELLFHNYGIIYRVEKECVLVLTIVHGSRDLSSKETKPWEVI